MARKTGKLESLSVQQVVSCGNIGGCGGSSPDKVFGYLAKTGVVTEAAYPYNDQAKKQNKESTCAITGVKQNLVAGFSYVTPVCYDEKSCNNQNEEDLVKALAWGPISVIIDANPLQLYVGGVMTSTSGCLNNFEAVNHAGQHHGQRRPADWRAGACVRWMRCRFPVARDDGVWIMGVATGRIDVTVLISVLPRLLLCVRVVQSNSSATGRMACRSTGSCATAGKSTRQLQRR